MKFDIVSEALKKHLLQDVQFKAGKKILKSGRIKTFSIKQYFIRFTLINNQGYEKNYELPYPFRVQEHNDHTTTFNYHLSSFCQVGSESLLKLKCLDSSNKSRLFDNIIKIIPLKY